MKKLLTMTAALMLLSTQLYAGNGDLIVNGNLGVGTGSPNARISVGAGSIVDENIPLQISTGEETPEKYIGINKNGAYGLLVGYNENVNKLGGAGALLRQVSSDPIGFVVNNTIRAMTILHNGNVGIGTTNPGQLVTVDALNGQPATIGTTQNGVLRLQVDQGIGWGEVLDMGMHIGVSGPPSYAWLQATNKSVLGLTYNMALNPNGGHVGIGTTTPVYSLDVAGTIRGNNVSPSDIRFKKDLQPIDASLTKLLSLNGVSYEWKTDEYKDRGFPEGRHYGVIAQEIEKVLPEVVNTAQDGTKSVAYTEIIPVLIEAMKAQQVAMDNQQKRISDLEAKIELMSAR